MERIADQMERDLRSKYSHVMVKWYEAVDWTEPLIVGLFVFHRLYPQFALFVLIIMMVVSTEALNKWARKLAAIATQRYFDEQGVLWASSTRGRSWLQVSSNWWLLSMKNMVDMVVIVKRAEYRQQLKAKKDK
ncbi:Transmembrane protein 18 [Phytophthora cactorum]|nr:Transmembrane protein 18 [Phytophthora cactorum]